MENNKKQYKINYICELEDKELEKNFFDWDIKKSLKYINVTILFLGLLSFAFVIPDYMYMTDRSAFAVVFVGRLLCLFLFIKIGGM
jgi:hypothetical protein